MKKKLSIKRLVRSSVYYVHLLLGITVGFYLLVMGLTGSLLVFHHAIGEAVAPQFHELELTQQELDQIDPIIGIDKVYDIGKELFPDRDVARIYLPHDDHGYLLYINRPDNTDNLGWGDQIREIAVHPVTYEVLGNRPYYGTFFNTVYAIHMHWLAKIPGWFFNGFASFFALILLLSGLWLWWPGLKPKLWKQRFKINKTSIRRLAWDVHGFLGALSLIFLVILTVTGSVIIFKPVIDVLYPAPPPPQTEPDLNAPIQPLGTMYQTAQQQRNDATVYLAKFNTHPKQGTPQLVHFYANPNNESTTGRLTVTMARQGGSIVSTKDTIAQPQATGDILMDWSTWLHFGHWAGIFSKLLYVLIGFVPTLLFVTGIYLYLKKWQSKRNHRKAKKQLQSKAKTLGKPQSLTTS
ncbi:PepSY domain-containing protein [Planctomycetota bacterium]|nr:PepSY domain-containing protein [Planctomycetota bacterium]